MFTLVTIGQNTTGSFGLLNTSASNLNIFNNDIQSESSSNSSRSDIYFPWDNPWNYIDFQTVQDIRLKVNLYVYPVVFIVGVTTNVLNCLVFYRQGLKDRMNLCLFWLAVTDMFYILTLSGNAVGSYVFNYDEIYGMELQAKYLAYGTGLAMSFLLTSGSISMVIAVERCVCVVFPLKAQTLMSTATMAAILSTITLLLQLGFSVFPIRMEPVSILSPVTGEPKWIVVPRQTPHKEVLAKIYGVVFDLLLQFALPIVCISVVAFCTVITLVKLKMALSWRMSSAGTSGGVSETQTKQTRLTKMLVLVSCIYIVCSIPGCTLALWREIDPRFSASGHYANLFDALHNISYILFAGTNSSVNFFVYVWRSSRYKAVLKAMCRCSQPATPRLKQEPSCPAPATRGTTVLRCNAQVRRGVSQRDRRARAAV